MKRDIKKEEQYKKEVIDILTAMATDKRVMTDFLTDIMTPAELREIAVRWQIVKKLKAREHHRDIAFELGIGLGTITRGSRTLMNPAGGFNQALSKTKQ